MGFEADEFNSIEMSLGIPEPGKGGRPISPIRKRGVHRAAKRGESWAIPRKIEVVSDSRVGYNQIYLMSAFYERERIITIL